MHIAIIQFPGSNCEAESARAVRAAGMEAEEFLWNRDYHDLKDFDGYFIVGGFSYEDRSRAGIISALDPLMPRLSAEAEKGKPILGVCNGAQILVETGLVPGLKNYQVGMALAENRRVKDGRVLGTGYYNTWINIKLSVPCTSSAFTGHLTSSQIIRVPIAHGEGRFIIPDELLKELIDNNQTIFRYCDERGEISEEFPINPNGAAYNLAAITNARGNIMAIMPHPERATAGQQIFTSIREYITEQNTIVIPTGAPACRRGRKRSGGISLKFTPPPIAPTTYHLPANSFALPVELLITDNEAATVESALNRLGLNVKISRATHWEVALTPNSDAQKIKDFLISSGELFNSNKERILPSIPSAAAEGRRNHSTAVEGSASRPGEDSSRYLLVRFKDDTLGAQKKQEISSRLGISDIVDIKRGTLWKITAPHGNIEELVGRVLTTHILFNPFSQDCFVWNIPTLSNDA